MQDLSSELRRFMDARSLSQSALAKASGVNQATVSRALRKRPQRHSEALSRLCIYAGLDAAGPTLSEGAGRSVVIRAFMEVWDGTDAHAVALAKLVAASKGLVPEKSNGHF